MIKGIFFDVGGTLCGSLDNISRKPSFKKILADFTHRSIGDFNVKKQNYLWTSSVSKKKLVIQLCQDLEIDDWKVLYEKLSLCSCKVSLYKDVKPCLKKLSTKYELGLLSNTTVWTAFDHNELGIGNYVKTSILSCEVGMVKPDIEIFDYAQKKIGLKSKELLYIGDNIEYDIIPALMANWRAVLLCRDKSIKDSPAPIISNLFELDNILKKINDGSQK